MECREIIQSAMTCLWDELKKPLSTRNAAGLKQWMSPSKELGANPFLSNNEIMHGAVISDFSKTGSP